MVWLTIPNAIHDVFSWKIGGAFLEIGEIVRDGSDLKAEIDHDLYAMAVAFLHELSQGTHGIRIVMPIALHGVPSLVEDERFRSAMKGVLEIGFLFVKAVF